MPLNQDIERLFSEAKNSDEFEFICTLINYKGLGTRLNTSNLLEWFDAIENYIEQFKKEQNNHKQIRIGLLLYSTFFESSDLYNILGSLSRIILGYRSAPYLYFKHPKADRWYGTSEKISMVNEILVDSGFKEMEHFFESIHHKQIRNTFFHSAYSLEEDEYHLHDSDSVIIDGVGHPMVSISEFLVPNINKVIEFFVAFKTEFFSHFKSYKTNKIVEGRFPEPIDITILGSDSGLVGFEAGSSSIRLKNDFWTGMNIRFDSPTEVDRYIAEELTRQIGKENVNSNDGSLQQLYDVSTERDIIIEKQDLSKVYARFAPMFQKKAKIEENDFKKTSLYKLTLDYFEKMYELDDSLIINQDYAVLMFYVADRLGDVDLQKKSLVIIIDCIDLNNLQEQILKNTLHIIKALKETRIDISEELKGTKRVFDSITTKEFNQLIEEIKNRIS
jgi:hypothetical protein